MNEELYEALEVCLQTLETGADLESALKRFPEMKDDLRPLLETSQQARLLAIPEVPLATLRRERSHVLQHAAEIRAPGLKPRKRLPLFSFPRLAASLAIALIFFLLSGTGLVRASNGALPGDHLYPVKRTWEDVRLLLVINPESREVLQSEFEQERLHEVDELMAEKRHQTIAFAGLVTEQNRDVWVVSGVPVHITAASRLPQDPVSAGATIMVNGWTNAQGYVEAERIEIMAPGLTLPALTPTETEGQQDTLDHEGSAVEQNDNQNQSGEELNSSSDESQSTSGSQDTGDSYHSGSNSNNSENGGGDQKSGGRDGKGGSGQEQNNSGGSGGDHGERDR
jgi:Domain of unknown function (DUF5667)